eukprot:SAG25_NODE_421_length_8214_cov_3.048429_8_plen_174_part_01
MELNKHCPSPGTVSMLRLRTTVSAPPATSTTALPSALLAARLNAAPRVADGKCAACIASLCRRSTAQPHDRSAHLCTTQCTHARANPPRWRREPEPRAHGPAAGAGKAHAAPAVTAYGGALHGPPRGRQRSGAAYAWRPVAAGHCCSIPGMELCACLPVRTQLYLFTSGYWLY